MLELPADYNALADSDCGVMKLTDSLCDPVVLIENLEGIPTAFLSGHIFRKGQHLYPKAASLEHTWIDDGKFIRPLPSDTPQILGELFDGLEPSRLTFPQVLSLRTKAADLPLEVKVSEEILEAATTASQRFLLSQQPEGLQATLYPYQEQGVAWMDDTLGKLGGLILADEMGLGKTLQIITLFLLRKPSKDNPALVVCPTSLIANWGLEIMKFAPGLTWAIHHGGNRARIHSQLTEAEVLLTTYDTLVIDRLLLSSIDWTYLIFDEAQALKNPDSNRRRTVSMLRRDYTIPVTGTPVETSLQDLWSLTDIAIPGLLGTRDEFSVCYPDSMDSAERLAEVTDPVILKRKLGDVADQLPERINVEIPVDLGADLSKAYEQTRQYICDTYPKAGQLVASGQLALFCAHPWLSTKDPEVENWEENVQIKKSDGFTLMTPKLEACIELLASAFENRRKVIIFAAYNNCREIIEEAAANLPVAYWNSINGSTPGEQRQVILDEFSNHEGNAALVLNPKAAGAGLNIQAASIVIHFTQYWNPALEAQASARSHRTGQKNPVTVYYLYYQNTVERIMLDRTEFRREMADAAVTVTLSDLESDLEKALSLSPVK